MKQAGDENKCSGYQKPEHFYYSPPTNMAPTVSIDKQHIILQKFLNKAKFIYLWQPYLLTAQRQHRRLKYLLLILSITPAQMISLPPGYRIKWHRK